MIEGHKDDMLVIQYPSTLFRNRKDISEVNKQLHLMELGSHYIMVPCNLDYWKVNWVSGRDATEVINYIKEHCPWVSIPMEGGEIVL